jgi:NADPH:quinone reductase-like Zn-dependent oxidoreductase
VKAVVQHRYGPPDVLRVEEVDKPALEDDGVLVRVHASSVNPAEWYAVTSPPILRLIAGNGLLKPKRKTRGADFAGTVEAVGPNHTRFKPGDQVFGGRLGAWAEYVSVRKNVAAKPANISFEQAGAIPTAGATALQGLRDHGKLQLGQRVLINGASGGVGTFAVQIAKALGGEVTAVCSTRHADLVRSLGADHVVDYKHEDFTRSGRKYDLLLDIAGSRSWGAYKRVLEPNATYVGIGAPKGGPLGPLGHLAAIRLATFRVTQRVVPVFIAQFSPEVFDDLRQLIESGKVTPVIDRTYPLSQVADALNYLGEGHAHAKIALTI